MNQDDYQKKIDEHRQSIGLEDETTELRRSRRSNSTKKVKKKSKFGLLPTLFFIFILIPVCIFIYVQFFYTPEKEEVEDSGIIRVESNSISKVNTEDEEEDAEGNADKEDGASDVVEQPPVSVPETEVEKETEKVEQPKEEEKVEIKPENKEEPKKETQSKTHIVREGETLYRIAVNYYKNGDAVERIKNANGLSSNEISVGQKLILP